MYTVERVNTKDKEIVNWIAQCYFNEWQKPIENTTVILNSFGKRGFPFQIIIRDAEKNLIATGGLYNNYQIGFTKISPDYKKYNPWLAMLYTIPAERGKGIGKLMCETIEKMAVKEGVKEIYLHTLTAERLYTRLNWKFFAKETYKGSTTVVMKKEI